MRKKYRILLHYVQHNIVHYKMHQLVHYKVNIYIDNTMNREKKNYIIKIIHKINFRSSNSHIQNYAPEKARTFLFPKNNNKMIVKLYTMYKHTIWNPQEAWENADVCLSIDSNINMKILDTIYSQYLVLGFFFLYNTIYSICSQYLASPFSINRYTKYFIISFIDMDAVLYIEIYSNRTFTNILYLIIIILHILCSNNLFNMT